MSDIERANRQFERIFDSRYKTPSQEETPEIKPKLIAEIVYIPKKTGNKNQEIFLTT